METTPPPPKKGARGEVGPPLRVLQISRELLSGASPTERNLARISSSAEPRPTQLSRDRADRPRRADEAPAKSRENNAERNGVACWGGEEGGRSAHAHFPPLSTPPPSTHAYFLFTRRPSLSPALCACAFLHTTSALPFCACSVPLPPPSRRAGRACAVSPGGGCSSSSAAEVRGSGLAGSG